MKTVLMFDRNTWIKQVGHRDPLIASLKKNYNVIDAAKQNPNAPKGIYSNLATQQDPVKCKLYQSAISRLAGQHYSRLPYVKFNNFYLQVQKEICYLTWVLDHLMTKGKIDAIVTEGNHQVAYYACLAAKEKYDIPVIGIENSFCGGKIYMDIHGGVGNEMQEMQELWDKFSPYHIDENAISSMNTNKGQVPRSFRNHVKKNNDGLDYIHKHEHMRAFSKYILVCGQVDNDSVVCRDISPLKNIDEFFSLILQATKDMNDVGIVFRIHPWDQHVTGNLTAKFLETITEEDKKRILVIKNKDYYTYNLLPHVDSIVTMTSQIGLEAASLKGIPVVTVGNAFYNTGNFTLNVDLEGENKENHVEKLKEKINESLVMDKQVMFDKAKCFASFLFNEYMVNVKDEKAIKSKIEASIQAMAKQGKHMSFLE